LAACQTRKVPTGSPAHRQDKLVPLRLPPLTSDKVPTPFGVLSMLPHGDLAALKLALGRKGVKAT